MITLMEWRKRAGKTQAECAALLSVSQATISKLEGGGVRPSIDLALEIERATSGAVPVYVWAGERHAEKHGAANAPVQAQGPAE